MLVYRGKLNWFNYALNEGFTLIFPDPEFKVGVPAIAAWQWTENAQGAKNQNMFVQGVIDSVVISGSGERQIFFHQNQYYRFQAIFSNDMKSITAVMSNPSGYKSSPTTLNNVYDSPLIAGILPRYFLGKMNWLNYAIDEMFLVIIPRGSERNSDVLAYWQWTVNDKGEKKANRDFKDIIRSAEQSSAGEIVVFGDDTATYYVFNGTIASDGNTFSVNMKNPGGAKAGPFVLALQVWSHAEAVEQWNLKLKGGSINMSRIFWTFVVWFFDSRLIVQVQWKARYKKKNVCSCSELVPQKFIS